MVAETSISRMEGSGRGPGQGQRVLTPDCINHLGSVRRFGVNCYREEAREREAMLKALDFYAVQLLFRTDKTYKRVFMNVNASFITNRSGP